MSDNQNQIKKTILLTLAIDLGSLEIVSKVIRFPGMDANPFEGELILPSKCLLTLKKAYEQEMEIQNKLAREVAERKVIEHRRKEATRKKHDKEIPGQKTLFEEEA